MSKVILVDENDKKIGEAEKLEAHQQALLHRAFSVFIFHYNADETLELLLQQRHPDKYHCGGLWTNSCCSHPQPGETTLDAAERRTFEELGIHVGLKEVGEFIYKAEFDNGLTEYEYDHVLIGFVNSKQLKVNEEEISAVEWIDLEKLAGEINNEARIFTPWFISALQIIIDELSGEDS